MLKKNIVIFCCLFFTKAYANDYSINKIDNTEWRGTSCSSYGDGLFQGTYNYHFKDNGKLESYIEHFTDLSCKTKSTYENSIQTQGSYEILKKYTQNNFEIYDLKVKLNHLNYFLYFNIKIKNNNMVLCYDSTRCSSYIKISN